jgi:hypothetical protein
VQSLVVVLLVAVIVYALVDCLQSPAPAAPGLPRGVWIALIVLLPGLGAAAWLAVRDRGAPSPSGSSRAVHPMGPDDDPEFLRRLGGPPAP